MPDPQRSESRRYWAAFRRFVVIKGRAKIGYASYLCFMLRRGRIECAGSVRALVATTGTALALEQVGISLRFPPGSNRSTRCRALAEAICSLASGTATPDPASETAWRLC